MKKWKCYCFKSAEKELLNKAIELMIPYIRNCNLADKFGFVTPDEKESIFCTEIWFLNPNESFEVDLLKSGIELTKCHPKDNQGNSVLEQ